MMNTVGTRILREKLVRVRQQLEAQPNGDPTTMSLNPALSPEAVEVFEDEHAIALPSDYRAFLIELGNGGAGPPCYGLFDLDASKEESRKTIFTLSDPFVPPLSTDEYVDLKAPGMLLLGHEGCAFYTGLAVSGPEAGTVWTYVDVRPGWVPLQDDSATLLGDDGEPYEWDGDYGHWYNAMLAPRNRALRVSFSRYYEQWLDAVLESGEEGAQA